jgi:hypothetical protein
MDNACEFIFNNLFPACCILMVMDFICLLAIFEIESMTLSCPSSILAAIEIARMSAPSRDYRLCMPMPLTAE